MAVADIRRTRREPSACGIGFIATRHGVAERGLVDAALGLCGQFDHRGAPGHGAGVLLDIPWALTLGRFPDHARLIAQRDVAIGMFFLPFDAIDRRVAVETVEQLADLAGADVLGWADVPIDLAALPHDAAARRTAPVVRQALFRRPARMGEEAWFACRYLLRLAFDENLRDRLHHDFAVCSLSNRTIVYRGLADLSRLSILYPDLCDPHFASRFALFHSRYSTNTTTAWRRAQPFWALAHNGEITTIAGNNAWMRAIGHGLIERLSQKHPALRALASRVRSVVCSGGSDSADLDDMLLALVAGGLSFAQGLIALLPEAPVMPDREPALAEFLRSMSTLVGACDGPAAIVACDGDEAVAHLDRNGLRPLWITTSHDYAVATSEITGTLDLGPLEHQRILGPGDSVVVNLNSGAVLFTDDVHRDLARRPCPSTGPRVEAPSGESDVAPSPVDNLVSLQAMFGMTAEDVRVLLASLAQGKLAVGSMGDDTPTASLLDRHPRRLDDYFKLRFAQETSPPIDPIRDRWVFDTTAIVGDRRGLWDAATGAHYVFRDRILSSGDLAWLSAQTGAVVIDATTAATESVDDMERAIDRVVAEASAQAGANVLVISDRAAGASRVPLPLLRVVSRLHERLAGDRRRHHVGIVADAGVWDVHQCALLLTLGADVVHPWLGLASTAGHASAYLRGLNDGLLEVMSMAGVTPSSAYCGAKLVEAVGLDRAFLAAEFPGVAGHVGGVSAADLAADWIGFHRDARTATTALVDVGQYRYRAEGRPHVHAPVAVRALHAASGVAAGRGDSTEAYRTFKAAVEARPPSSLLDLVALRPAESIAIDLVEPEEDVLWRFMVPGMSDGALSEPAHRAVARAMNVLQRWCRARFRRAGRPVPATIGPVANSGEGGFDLTRLGGPEMNHSIQYAGARFTITPEVASSAAEIEIKFAQGAKPGKGGQLPGKKVSPRIARQRGCEPGLELISPPVNHNLYSIEDVKLMLESCRHLNPDVQCALKFVATDGIDLVCLGGVNAGANRLHLSDGAGGTGAAKRLDQQHAGVPVAAVLPVVHDTLVEEGVRHLVELSVDGTLQTGRQVLMLALLGADRFGFGTSALVALGCSMLRQCHLAGPHPDDPTGVRRIGCTPGVATQDPAHVANFRGRSRHITRYLRHVANDVRAEMAAAGIHRLGDVIGRRDRLERRPGLTGKAARIDVSGLLGAPPSPAVRPDPARQSSRHQPRARVQEVEAATRLVAAGTSDSIDISGTLTNRDRAVGVGAAGVLARACGDRGIAGALRFRHQGAAGHFYAAYAVPGMEFRLEGTAADSCFTAAIGGQLVVLPPRGSRFSSPPTVVGNTFAYGARGGRAFIAGRAGNRFAICLRRRADGAAPEIVVEGVEANAFQYMTGGTVVLLGAAGLNLGAGLAGGVIYALDLNPAVLNRDYTTASALDESAAETVRALVRSHVDETGSAIGARVLASFDPGRFRRVTTCLVPEVVGD